MIDNTTNDFITMNRLNNYLSFIIYKEDREKMKYVEVMNTMAGFIKIGREFGILLDTGDYFVRRGKTCNRNDIIVDKKIADYINEFAKNIYIDVDVFPNISQSDRIVKKRGRKKNEKF